jgi:hypothetical protein
MVPDALATFSWDLVAEKWSNMFKEDLSAGSEQTISRAATAV